MKKKNAFKSVCSRLKEEIKKLSLYIIKSPDSMNLLVERFLGIRCRIHARTLYTGFPLTKAVRFQLTPHRKSFLGNLLSRDVFQEAKIEL